MDGIEKYCVKDHSCLPPYLYRVVYAGTRTGFWPGYGLVSDSLAPLHRPEHLAIRTVNNLNWKDKDKSPFINVFSSYSRARDWAEERLTAQTKNKNSNTCILTIDTKELGDTVVLRVLDVVTKLNLEKDINKKTQKDVADTYMCLHQVPAEAIIDREKLHSTNDVAPVESILRVLPEKLSRTVGQDWPSPLSSSIEALVQMIPEVNEETERGYNRHMLSPLTDPADFETLSSAMKQLSQDLPQYEDVDLIWFMKSNVVYELQKHDTDHPHLIRFSQLFLLSQYALTEQTIFEHALLATGMECGPAFAGIHPVFERSNGRKIISWDGIQAQLESQMYESFERAQQTGEVDTLRKLVDDPKREESICDMEVDSSDDQCGEHQTLSG